MPLTSAIDNAVIGIRNAEKVIEDSARKVASVPPTTAATPSPTLPRDNVEYSETISGVFTVTANATEAFRENNTPVNGDRAASSSNSGDPFNAQKTFDRIDEQNAIASVELTEELVRQQQAFTQIKANLALIEKTEDMLGTLADISS